MQSSVVLWIDLDCYSDIYSKNCLEDLLMSKRQPKKVQKVLLFQKKFQVYKKNNKKVYKKFYHN